MKRFVTQGFRVANVAITLLAYLFLVHSPPGLAAASERLHAGPSSWQNDLAPIGPQDWSEDRAAHLLERAGFGGTPEEIKQLAALSPETAVDRLVAYHAIDNSHLKPFDHSGVHDPGLEPFPPSRPATTALARKTGEALGIQVKSSGNRRLQPVVNKFFYWLRASMLETNRVGYWWADRMLRTHRPLEEKMALFWHGHFAVNESKVRDYRKHLRLLEWFQEHGSGNFRDLLLGVAQSPAMLSFLDAGQNVKGSPNENFAVNHGTVTMVLGTTRAEFVSAELYGWITDDLRFVVSVGKHDDGPKTVLGQTGNFDGIDVIDVILAQPATANFIAAKIYRYFVREELSVGLQQQLGNLLREYEYEIAPLLRTIFLSKDFYSAASYGTAIKSPVQLVISTYRKLGLDRVPGAPDFNDVTGALGQRLFYPPTVAGWAQGRSWITPGLLLARGNFVYEVFFPNISFIPHDRYPRDGKIRLVDRKIAQGMDISTATVPGGIDTGSMAESNMMADRDEAFNTRYGSYKGWQMAIQRVKPIPRDTARIDLRSMVLNAELTTVEQVVDAFLQRFLRVPVEPAYRAQMITFLEQELGTQDIQAAATYLEEPLRLLLHLLMSAPEYQLG